MELVGSRYGGILVRARLFFEDSWNILLLSRISVFTVWDFRNIQSRSVTRRQYIYLCLCDIWKEANSREGRYWQLSKIFDMTYHYWHLGWETLVKVCRDKISSETGGNQWEQVASWEAGKKSEKKQKKARKIWDRLRLSVSDKCSGNEIHMHEIWSK